MRYKMGMDPAAALGGLWEIPPAHPPGSKRYTRQPITALKGKKDLTKKKKRKRRMAIKY